LKNPDQIARDFENSPQGRRVSAAFARLVSVMDTLRDNCPWDKKQTFESLRNLTLEESYELADAIVSRDLNGIREEVGDLLLHMTFYARLGAETGAFDIADAIDTICEKLIRRHPHIYSDLQVADAEEVKRNWENIKRVKEKHQYSMVYQ
jgi:XTP/dITP diphosphohydrolase